MIDLEKYYDEYEYLYDEEPVRRKPKASKESEGSSKKKKKNFKRGGKQELWDEYLDNSEEDFGKEIMKDIYKEKAAQKALEKKEEKKEEKKKSFDGPNTHLIRGVQINYDNVISIARVENMYNGNKTFGIKFIFKSKDNGAFRIIWFGQDETQRNELFAQETKFWASLKLKH